jgi:hypothetical protein
MKRNPSLSVLCVGVLLLLTVSACGGGAPAEAPVPEVTNTLVPTVVPTNTLVPTATPIPTRTPMPTATPNLAATQKYDSFYALVEELAGEGVIASTDGTYHSLDDYSDEFAKSGYYNWVTYDAVETSNFIMQAHVKLSNATNENVFKSACGFVMSTVYTHHAIFFALDGNVNFRTDGADRGSNYLDASLFQNPDGLQLTLVLSNKTLRFYVNDKQAFTQVVYDSPLSVGPSILSGTSEGFGTRCEFTDVVLWDME